jgi:sensor c-di-GMP phosphodiesterase-like protein
VELRQQLRKHKVSASNLKLEITERAIIDSDDCRARIKALRRLGHPVAVDDFGTGYSSLSYLEKFELDTLKIDKSFVDAIGTDAVTSPVIGHVIDMAKSLKLDIVAEGIETAMQKRWLRAHHVEFGQGFLFSPALPAREFISYVKRHSDDHSPNLVVVAGTQTNATQ